MRKRVHKQQLLLPLLMWLMLLALMPAQLSARDFNYTYQGQTITYSVLDEDAKTVETKNADSSLSGSLILPSTVYDGETAYTLTQIGDSTFISQQITAVEVPQSVTKIGKCAFFACQNLTAVEIPNSVNTIGEGAFAVCRGLKKFKFADSSQRIVLGLDFLFESPVEELYIGRNWKYGTSMTQDGFCESVISLTISNNVTKIEDFAFYNCTGLTSLEIPSSVINIGNFTFSSCTGLTAVEIPNTVKSIGTSAFTDCTNLTSFMIADGSEIINFGAQPLWKSPIEDLYVGRNFKVAGDYPLCDAVSVTIGNIVTDIPETAFLQSTSLKNINFGTSVETIGKWAFLYCPALTTVEIPNSVTFIGQEAFANCDSLNSFKLADGSKTIVFESNPFDESPVEDMYIGRNIITGQSLCKTVSSLTFGNTVTDIPERAFSNAKLLKTLDLGTSVKSIGDRAFEQCESLTSLEIPNSVTNLGEYVFSGCDGLTTLSISKSITNISKSAFSSCYGLTSIEIPSSVTTIGNWAFSNCRGLTSILIPTSVTTINDKAFSGCFKLPAVEIPNSVTSIGNHAFDNCHSLKTISLPNSITSIEDGTFFYCPELTSIEIPNSVTSIGNSAFEQCSKMTSVEIPNSVTSIGENAFGYCTALTAVNIPNSVTSIGACAFMFCSGLQNVELSKAITKIENNTFNGCKELTDIEIPNSVTEIGLGAFVGCSSLTSVEIPNTVKVIENYAFKDCSGIKEFRIADGSDEIEFGHYIISVYDPPIENLYIGRNFSSESPFNCLFNSIIIGNSVTDIPNNAFYGTGAVNLNLGSSLKTIGENAFKYCGISELVLPPDLETIGENAFAGNDIKKIAIGSKMTEIGNKAFDGSVSLEGVSVAALTPPVATDSTFSNYDCTLLVAPGSESAYLNAASCWNRFKTQAMVVPEKVEIEEQTDLTLEPGDTIRLAASIYPANVTLPYIFWRSTNPAFATVDNNGNVTRTAEAENSGEQIHISAQGDTDDAQTNQCTIIAETLYADAPIAEITIKDPSSAVTDITTDGGFERPNDVYNLQGVCLKRNATLDDVDALAPGLYIIGGKKVLVK